MALDSEDSFLAGSHTGDIARGDTGPEGIGRADIGLGIGSGGGLAGILALPAVHQRVEPQQRCGQQQAAQRHMEAKPHAGCSHIGSAFWNKGYRVATLWQALMSGSPSCPAIVSYQIHS